MFKCYFKRYWHSAVCVLCAFLILFVQLFTLAVPASAVDVETAVKTFTVAYSLTTLILGTEGSELALFKQTLEWYRDNKLNEEHNRLIAQRGYYAFFREFVSQSDLTYDEFVAYFQAMISADSLTLGFVPDMDIVDYFTAAMFCCGGIDAIADAAFYPDDPDEDFGFIDDGDNVTISAEAFNDVVTRLNAQYNPKNTTDRLSWQNNFAWITTNGSYYSFFYEGCFGNTNYTDIYFVPFYYTGLTSSKYYYGLNQFHFYQQVSQDEEGNNVVSMYCDTWNWFDGDNSEHSIVLVTDELATYRYGRISVNWSWSADYIDFYFYQTRTDFYSNKNGKSVRVYLDFDPYVYDLTDLSLNTKNSFYSISYDNHCFYEPTDETLEKYDYMDIGFFLADEVINMGAYDMDLNKFPSDYTITVSGDTINNYIITDPDSGKSSTINNFITNNYYYTTDGDDGGSSGGTVNNWNIEFGDFIANIKTSIETAITNVFVADYDVINGLNLDLKDSFESKFPFLTDFKDIFNSLFVVIIDNNFVYAKDINSDGSADGDVEVTSLLYPKWEFTIDFFGEEMTLTLLDFSMYAEPLYYVRIVACAFLYLTYFVKLAKYLPKLIGGVLDMSEEVTSFDFLGGNDNDS